MRNIALLVVLSFCFTPLTAQDYGGTWFGLKGGMTLGTQQWNSFDQNPLVAYHGIFSIEGVAAEQQFSLFAQLGYHVKGSSIRRRLFGNAFNPGSFVTVPPRRFMFQNISLVLGGKQVIKRIETADVYYLFGIRGDYTVDTNLDEYDRFIQANPNFAGIYPLDVYYSPTTLVGVRRINYGITLGGGLNFPLSEYIEGVVEFTVNPDFSLQYEQPEIPNVLDPFTNQTRSIPERRIRNLTFEVTVGCRFLRKVEYID
ncbi:MAG: hypothetical protein AAGJ82_07260 [Bacteroidota bacterium]